MKRIIKNILMPAFALAALTLGACSDWNDTESLDIHTPTLENQNEALYKQYLAALCAYKQSEHAVTYLTMRNLTEAPSQRNEHLTNMPDSADFICVTTGANLHPVLVKEIAEVHKKGTRVVYKISFDAIEAAWKVILEEEEANKPEPPTEEAAEGGEGEGEGDGEGGEEPAEPTVEERFLEFCKTQTVAQLAYFDLSGFDGVEITYTGRAPQSMTEEVLAAYKLRQETFFGAIKTWYETHPNALLFFRGNPQNLVDQSILPLCRNIIIPQLTTKSAEKMGYAMIMASVSGVPTDRFLVGVTIPSIIDPTIEAGYFSGYEADGKTRLRATKGAAQWVIAPAAGGYTKSGIAIDEAQNDYFNIKLVYKNIREAIYVMNPTPKN